jgi:Tol biopolymer transport system component
MRIRRYVGLTLVIACVILASSCGSDSSWNPTQARTAYVAVTMPSGSISLKSTAKPTNPERLHNSIRSLSAEPVTTLGSVKADGTDQIDIPTLVGWFDDISITPDGKFIIYAHEPDIGNWHIDKVSINGGTVTALTDGTQESYYPNVTPKGDKVVYVNAENGPWQLHSVNLDGSGDQLTLNMPTVCQHEARVSPDGNSVLLYMHDGGYAPGIYLVKIDNSAAPLKLLDYSEAPLGDAEFSPDGEVIIYTGYDTDHNYQIFSMSLDGSNKNQETSGSNCRMHPLSIAKDTVVIMGDTDTGTQLFSTTDNGVSMKQITSGTSLKTFHNWIVLDY